MARKSRKNSRLQLQSRTDNLTAKAVLSMVRRQNHIRLESMRDFHLNQRRIRKEIL